MNKLKQILKTTRLINILFIFTILLYYLGYSTIIFLRFLLRLIKRLAYYLIKFEFKFKLISFNSLFLLIIIFLSYIIGYIYFNIYIDLPNNPAINVYSSNQTTKIFDRKGNLLYELYKQENRDMVKLIDIPKPILDATLAVEDQSFWTHRGISLTGIIRSIKKIVFDNNIQGGSTITQQLVKNRLLNNDITIARKIKEALLAIKIEKKYSKNEILEMYFNEINYGGESYGIKSAAKNYFGKDLKDLNMPEITMLVGLPASPSLYSPLISDPKFSKKRQKEVLEQMENLNLITDTQAKEIFDTPIQYARQQKSIVFGHFVNYVRAELESIFGTEITNKGGLKVITSIDPDIQLEAEKIVRTDVDRMKKNNVKNGSLLVSNPASGEILAMVGSKDFWDTSIDGNVNITTSLRQPGSSIKPINYSLAFELGYKPYSKILDSPVSYKSEVGPDFIPKNYDNSFHGVMTLKHALANSYNVPAVKLLHEIGVPNFLTHAEKLGISSYNDITRYGLSITLGAGEVKMTDMNTVYGVFASNGFKQKLDPFLRIYNSNNEVLYSNECANLKNVNIALLDLKNTGQTNILGESTELCKRERVLSDLSSYYINEILSDNKERSSAFGFNSNLDIKKKEVAVKTGTTTNLKDNWAIGYTNEFVVSAWIGNNDNQVMRNIASGYTSASLIWRHIFDYLIDHYEVSNTLKIPDSLVSQEICPLTNTLACRGCKNIRVVFEKDKIPKPCDYELYNSVLERLTKTKNEEVKD